MPPEPPATPAGAGPGVTAIGLGGLRAAGPWPGRRADSDSESVTVASDLQACIMTAFNEAVTVTVTVTVRLRLRLCPGAPARPHLDSW
jgi:hypothetical protein